MENCRLFLVLLILTGFLYACGSDDTPDPGDPDDPTKYTLSENCDSDTVYFVNNIRPILITYCATSGCHDPITAEQGFNATTYTGIISGNRVVHGNSAQSQIYQRITSTNPLLQIPPEGHASLDARQKELIRKWIDQGGRNNECIESCNTENITYSGTVKEIIADYCGGCHGGQNPEAGLNLTTYNQVRLYGEAGILVGSIRKLTGFVPMPLYGEMGECKIDQIVAWVNAGMPE